MEQIKITLEDCGQDFTTLYTDENGMVVDVQPYHHPPHIMWGFLRYRIQKIEHIES